MEAETLYDHFARRPRPLVGLLFYRAHWLSGNLAFVDALVRALEGHGCDTLPVFCRSLRPPAAPAVGDAGGAAYVLERYFLHPSAGSGGAGPGAAGGRPRINVLISTLSFAAGRVGTPSCAGQEQASEAGGEAGAWLVRLGLPVLQALVATDGREAWAQRAVGLRPLDVAMQVALPEFDGRVITVPVAFKEDAPTPRNGELWPGVAPGALYVPDEERCAGLAAQAAAWARLRRTPPSGRRVALVLGNSPPTNGRLGNAVGLDTPASLLRLLVALRAAGYGVGDLPESGDALMHRLIGAGTYDAESGHVSAPPAGWDHWNGPPALRLGNVVVAAQPPRGWSDDPEAIYHDPELPPPAPYVAFYRWLRSPPPAGFGAHAVVHLGKHGTLEWLPGKAVGLSATCAPDALLGEMPLVYPFAVNDPGEGTQAKRRTHAVLVGHMVPPLAPAGRYGELAELERLIQEQRAARVLDPAKLPLLQRQIWEGVRREALDDDLHLQQPEGQPAFDRMLARLEGYLDELQRATIRDGLHVLGRAPTGQQRDHLLDAMLRLAPEGGDGTGDGAGPANDIGNRAGEGVSQGRLRQRPHQAGGAGETGGPSEATDAPGGDGRASLRARLGGLLDRTGEELDAVLGALEGGYVPAGPSGSPSRGMWNVLPTGRNFYSVDPQAIPSPAAWETGRRLAAALLERHLADTGRYPDTVGLVVWGTAAMRTHGDDVAQALALLGVRPLWQPETGRVSGLEVVSLAELGRPRIDVTLHISGLFRDAFPHLVELLDRAVQTVAVLDEPATDNFVAAHVKAETSRLRGQGVGQEEASRRASLRLFGSKPGCYGAGLLPLIDGRNWRTPDDLARAYETWSAYAYGAGVPGRPEREAFRARFGAIDVALKNQDNREHDLFDSDDYFQYHGGMVVAARALRAQTGAAPGASSPADRPGQPGLRAYFGDSADPQRPAVRELSEEARRVFRSRVMNPNWLAAMRRHGYKGAMEMAATVDYLFGYDATAGVASDWMYERLAQGYVFDPQQEAFFRHSNPWALRDVAARLLEAASRGLWARPAPETLQRLRQAYLALEGDLEAGPAVASWPAVSSPTAAGSAPLSLPARGWRRAAGEWYPSGVPFLPLPARSP